MTSASSIDEAVVVGRRSGRARRRRRSRRRRWRRTSGRRRGGGCRRPATRSAPPSPTAGCAAPGPRRSARAARRRRPGGTPRRGPSRTAPMIESVSACGCSCTAVSTATRGRVTRRAAPRSRGSASNGGCTARVWTVFWNESRKTLGLRRCAAGPGRAGRVGRGQEKLEQVDAALALREGDEGVSTASRCLGELIEVSSVARARSSSGRSRPPRGRPAAPGSPC